MKPIFIGAVLVVGLIGTAKADLPDCRGVSSPARIEKAKHAKTDPAVAFKTKHAKTAMPASVVCESKVWEAVHGTYGRRALAGPLGNGGMRSEDASVQAYAGPPVDLRPVIPV